MLAWLAAVGRFGVFAGQVALRLASPRGWELTGTVARVGSLFRRCLLPVVATTTPLGMVMALQGLSIFDLYGAQRLLSPLISVATFRELSPVLASVLVAAQGGSAYAAELGAMRIREELDATEVMAIDPLQVHVVPRFVAVLVACPLLNAVGSLGGLVGGWISAVLLKGEPSGVYWANLFALTQASDLTGGFVKALVFGGVIGMFACWHGYHATGGAPGVGRAVNDTVVHAATTLVVVNYFLTALLFGTVG